MLTDACEDGVHGLQHGPAGRHVAPQLGHDDGHTGGPQQRGLTTHIGTCRAATHDMYCKQTQ